MSGLKIRCPVRAGYGRSRGYRVLGWAGLILSLLNVPVGHAQQPDPTAASRRQSPPWDPASGKPPPWRQEYEAAEWTNAAGVGFKRINNNDVIVSHQPGCVRDPAVPLDQGYIPKQSPGCRERVPGPFFPHLSAPPFKYPEAKPQTHGLDLTQLNYKTAEAYFKWLCTNEAGTWVYRKVSDVDGVFAMRNRPMYGAPVWQRFDRFYVEDPWGQINGGFVMSSYGGVYTGNYHTEGSYLLPEKVNGFGPRAFRAFEVQKGFDFYERPVLPEETLKYRGFKYLRFERPWPKQPSYTSDVKDFFAFGPGASGPGADPRDRKAGEVWLWALLAEREALVDPKPHPTNEIKSRYGFFWRGIERTPQDRLLGIGGGEEFVVDLKTNEIIALRRGFVWLDRKFYQPSTHTHVDWVRRQSCAPEKEFLLSAAVRPRDPIVTRGIDLRTAPTPEELLKAQPTTLK